MRMHFCFSCALFFSIGTHYFGINNLQQPWNSWTGRKKLELKPNNPTDRRTGKYPVSCLERPSFMEGCLPTVYRASQMSFVNYSEILTVCQGPQYEMHGLPCTSQEDGLGCHLSNPGESALTVDFVIYWSHTILLFPSLNPLTF